MSNFLTKEQLEKLNTKRLLAYKNKLLKYPENSKDSWGEMNINVISKESLEWQEVYLNVKSILATREHIR